MTAAEEKGSNGGASVEQKIYSIRPAGRDKSVARSEGGRTAADDASRGRARPVRIGGRAERVEEM